MKKRITLLTATLLLITACGGKTSSAGLSSEEPAESSLQPSSTITEVTSSSELPSTSELPSSEPSSSVPEVVTVSIGDVDNPLVGEKIQLSATYSDENQHTSVWSIQGDSTIDQNGLLTCSKAGKVTVTVTDSDDPTITASKEITITLGTFNLSDGFGNWDFADFKSKGVIKTTKNNAEWPYCELSYAGIEGQKYYAEATMKILSTSNDAWNRVSVGHRNIFDDGYVFRGYCLSCNAGTTNIQKCVTMETPNNWGITTDRYQFWNFHPYSSLNSQELKLATLRYNNEFYYFVNDQLYNVETLNDRFNNLDTKPTIMVAEMHIEASACFATADTTKVEEVYQVAQNAPKFLPSASTNSIDNSGSFIFGDKTISNVKDNGFRSKGDAVHLKGGADAKIAFDVKIDEYTDDKTAASVVLNLNRYNGPVYADDTRGFWITRESYGMTGWNMNGDLTHAVGNVGNFEEEDFIKAGETHHIEILRSTSFGYRMYVDSDYAIDWGWDEYNQDMIVWLGARCCKATISNFAISYPVA